MIEDDPIGSALDGLRASFDSICANRNLARSSAIDQLTEDDLRDLTLPFLSALHPLATASGTVRNDLLKLITAVCSDFDFNLIKPLLNGALGDKPQDVLIWALVSSAAVEPTPRHQTPWSHNTASLLDSSEFRQNVDPVLKSELEHVYVGVPNFHKAFFGDVPDLDTVSAAVFRQCTEGDDPLFQDEWSGWPADAKESDVLIWFDGLIPKLEALAGDHVSIPTARRKLLAQPRTPLLAGRSMDIGFVTSDTTFNHGCENSRYRWSQVLVAGELNSNPQADKAWMAWIDLARYAREVLSAKDTCRFVLGFTLCGSLMRVWEFDRLGGTASEQFDINKEDGALQFVTTVLGFLWMNEDSLGYDPTIITSGGERYIEIERDGHTERLVFDKVMKRAPRIVGRATTCWKAHRKEDPQTPIVIKDSWQLTDRDEEGLLIQEATEKGVTNVARYYHHETVRVHGADDDVQNNVRKGLDITKTTHYRSGRSIFWSSESASRGLRQGGSGSAGVKRPSTETDAALPPSKRSCSASSTKPSSEQLPNRVHRRVIVQDYGKPIYKASSRVALLAALEACIEGHRSLHEAGFLHRDISINNLLINEDENNPSSSAFLIDLDHAIRVQHPGASGATARTGTRPFMAVGVLLGEQHSFMHDLESFFWVLLWLCIHHNGPDDGKTVPLYDKWNYVDMDELADSKKGEVSDERDFIKSTEQYFTPFYKPLAPWVNRLRKAVFPDGRRWRGEDTGLYSRMQEILREARKDEKVVGG